MKFKNHFFALSIFIFTSFLFFNTIYSQTLLVTPDTLYMGQIPVSSKNVRQIEVFNLSPTSLEISNFSISNDDGNNFKILNNPGSVSLRQLQSVILQIEYTPTTNDSNGVQLVITSNASTSPDKILLYGKGLINSPVTFERIFGDEEANIANSVQQTVDGGYILGGSTVIPGEDFTDMYVVKTDVFGAIEWEAVHGGDETEEVTTILETDDGSYLAFGQTDSDGAGKFDFYLVKFSSTGDVIWENTFGGNKDEKSADMVKTSDGGYLLLGSTLSFGDNLNTDVYLVKVDSEGNELWNKRYGGNGGDSGDRLTATKDGNYAILASTASFGAGGFDIWLIKINNDGTKLWDKTFGGSEDEEGNGIAELPDESLILVGYTVSFGAGAKDIYLIKTSSTGSELWNKVKGGIYQDFATNVVSEENGIIYTARLPISIDQSKEILVKTDFDGNEIWQSQFNGGANNLTLSVEGNIIVAGSTGKYGNDSEVYFLNVNENGAITAISDWVEESPSSFQLLNNYPNPFNPSTIISYQIPENSFVNLTIYNGIGQKIRTLVNKEQTFGNYNVRFNANGLSTGVYIYCLKTDKSVSTKKMVFLK